MPDMTYGHHMALRACSNLRIGRCFGYFRHLRLNTPAPYIGQVTNTWFNSILVAMYRGKAPKAAVAVLDIQVAITLSVS